MSTSAPAAHYLQLLNPHQLKAVQHRPDVPLKILAGPGSGKTKVLTSRIAHLILDHSLPPSSICAVTFTNKAANEMRERLEKLIGKEKTTQVKLGTFHALCALFLRKYGQVVGLGANFTICDADESKKIISGLLKKHKDFLDDKDITLKDGTVLSMISKAKSKGLSADDLILETRSRVPNLNKTNGPQPSTPSNDIDHLVAEIYKEYEKTLRRNNSLDFDDLLVFGVRLFTQHDKAVRWCKHVLVDEFQDTNVTQYELMTAIAVTRCITVVGDPDQSIYGWRSAEVGNLARMQKDFPTTEQIFLEQNYRSTGSILKASLAIVSQDKSRIAKSLHTCHPSGTTPVLRSFSSEQAEAGFMAMEIKRLVAHMGGMLRWGDFVVLLRFNALSRVIESALQKEGIPSRVLGGHKFFERLEIKDLLAYLQLVDNPHFAPAFTRAVNVPSRGIGEKTLMEINSRAERTTISQLEVVGKIHDGKIPDIKPPVKRKLASFVTSMRLLRNLASEGASPADLIRKLLELIEYEAHLKKTQPDWESRWENVQELITFASDVEVDIQSQETGDASREAMSPDGRGDDTPLRLFLQASMLSSAGDNQSEAESKEKVTISTCHAAKGLEWPVVMVPAVEQGTFPFYRTDDVQEERRLLYVACTRAQGLLYLSHVTQRRVAGETKKKDLSEFVSTVVKESPGTFINYLPEFSSSGRAVMARVLERPEPLESDVAKRVAEFDRTTRHRISEFDLQPHNNVPSFAPSTRPTNVNEGFIPSGKFLLPNSTTAYSAAKPISTTNQIMPGKFTTVSTRPSSKPTIKPYSTNPLSTNRITNTKPSVVLPAPKPTLTKPVPQASPTVAAAAAVVNITPSTIHVPTGPMQSAVAPSAAGVKRRLGMGRTNGGYSNKKFKPPT